MRKPAIAASATPRRRARTLVAALSVLVVGTALYAHNVRAAGEQFVSHPRDSRGISTLATTAAVATANAGEIAEGGLRASPSTMAIAWTSPWGRIERPLHPSPIR